LGGIVSGVMAGVEPALTASAPIVGAGGLTDVGPRVDLGNVLRAMHLRMMGPFVVAERGGEGGLVNGCQPEEFALLVRGSRHNWERAISVACIPAALNQPETVIAVDNISSGETRCAGFFEDSALVPIATDEGDALRIRVFE